MENLDIEELKRRKMSLADPWRINSNSTLLLSIKNPYITFTIEERKEYNWNFFFYINRSAQTLFLNFLPLYKIQEMVLEFQGWRGILCKRVMSLTQYLSPEGFRYDYETQVKLKLSGGHR